MLARAYRCVFVSTGNLLRSEVKAETELGRMAQEKMTAGGLMPTSLVLSLIKRRLAQKDAATNGWILDGYPRTGLQAQLLVRDGLVPDAVITLERPDDLVKEVCLGRMTDSATGIIYHPIVSPAPEEVRQRLTWRLDDTEEVIERRLEQHRQNHGDVLSQLSTVPSAIIDTARNEIAAFQDICQFVDRVAAAKMEAMGGRAALEALRLRAVDARDRDFEEEFNINAADAAEADARDGREPPKRTLLAAVQRCNRYDMRNYLPVYVTDQQVGFVGRKFAAELTPYLGHSVDVVEQPLPPSIGGGPAEQKPQQSDQAVVLAPFASSLRERTGVMAGLVQGLVESGAIPRQAVRHELQDVRAFTRLAPMEKPLVRLERAAMIHFGIPSYGVHVNGFVPADGDLAGGGAGPGSRVWIGVRSASKATYPGLWDQIAAGGQPSGLSFKDNVLKECAEEASLPRELLKRLRPAGLVSYRFATKKGLSTKMLAVYDLPLPADFIPFNGDGEVEEFMLMPVEEALAAVRDTPEKFKPNSALVLIDFALRHGWVDADDPDYVELCHLLRAGLSTSRRAFKFGGGGGGP